jgi:hypothetical protein
MAVSARLKFTHFVELILARLYEREQSGDSGSFAELNEIARDLKVPIPEDWVFDAGKVLEARGLAEVHYFMGGGCIARLTGEGRMYVEEERGTGVIKEYHDNPGQFVVVVGERNQVAVAGAGSSTTQTVGVPEERRPAFELLNRIKQAIDRENSLSEREKGELRGDVEAVESQLRKREPNRAAIAALLEPMSQIASIAATVASLIKLLNP